MSNIHKGILFALTAAAMNASIGIFSKALIHKGLNIQDIAFLKTICAFVLLSIGLPKTSWREQKAMLTRQPERSWQTLSLQIAGCAFLGIFVLFFFETNAYQYGLAANVVVILMASAAISALIFGKILLNEHIAVSAILGVMLAISGISVISWAGGADVALLGNAIIAGSGYGLFSVLIQKFELNGGLPLTRWLMAWGSVYLLLPFCWNAHEIVWDKVMIFNVLALAVLPTIVGFYCTTKALTYISAARVQVTELSEPIFAACLAWLCFAELPNGLFWLGAMLIVFGIILINQMMAFSGSLK